MGGQSGEQVAAVSFAGDCDVRPAGRMDRRLKARQVDRHVARAEDDFRRRRFQQPHVGGGFGGAHAKQQLAEIAGLPYAIDFLPEEGARFLARNAPARAIEQQVGKQRERRTRHSPRLGQPLEVACVP